MGLDLVKGIVRNNLEAGVIEPAMSKVKIIQVRELSFGAQLRPHLDGLLPIYFWLLILEKTLWVCLDKLL